MKKLKLIFLLFILNADCILAQTIFFNKRIDITGDWEVCRGIVLTKGGYLVAGGYEVGIYLSKLDSIGNLKWTKYYEYPSYTYFFGLSGSLFQTNDKYYAICGGRVQWPIGHSILIKVDSLGNKKWEKEYPLTDCSNTFNSGNISKDRGYILTGYANIVGLKYSYLLLKTDSLGNQQWYKTYTDNDPNRSYAGKCVIQTPDKGYCIGGEGDYHISSNFYGIAEIIKTDSLGNQQWKKTYGNPLYCNWGTMLSISKDSCIIATYRLGNTSLPEDDKELYITKLGLDGSVKWVKRFGLITNDNWSSWIKTLDDGSFILSGQHRVKDTIDKSIGWLHKLDINGDNIWYREYAVIQGPQDRNQLFQVTPTPDNGFASAGSLDPNSSGGTQDIWVFKTDSMGCLVPHCDVGITEFNPNTGTQMFIYPNPFKEAFAINYYIPKENKTAIFKLYDINGKLIYHTCLTKGVNQLQVVASALTPGIYIAHLIINDELVITEKIIKN